MSGRFCRGLIPGIWPMLCGWVATKVLQTRGIMVPPAILGVVFFFANIGLNVFFIDRLGFVGCPTATTVTRFLQMVVSLLYVVYNESSSSGPGCGMTVGSALREGTRWRAVGAFLALGIPGGIMLGLEASSFDITTALAGLLGTVAVDAYTILNAVLAFAFLGCPFGLAVAGSMRVGNLLGSGDHKTARVTSFLTIAISALFMVGVSAALWLLRDKVGTWFVSDERVVSAVAAVVPIMVPVEVFDGVQGACQGILRGMGKQRLILGFNVVGFWLGGMLPGYFLAFRLGLGLRGLLIGLASGIFCVALLEFGCFLTTDMEKEARAAHARVKNFGSGEQGCSFAGGYEPLPEQESEPGEDGAAMAESPSAVFMP
uniref:Multidrug resistance protein, MATE family n=1 Tax=Tetraselmis sp. GSL018 TaxID=582737 RepID=A0A061S8P2_9CHLO